MQTREQSRDGEIGERRWVSGPEKISKGAETQVVFGERQEGRTSRDGEERAQRKRRARRQRAQPEERWRYSEKLGLGRTQIGQA